MIVASSPISCGVRQVHGLTPDGNQFLRDIRPSLVTYDKRAYIFSDTVSEKYGKRPGTVIAEFLREKKIGELYETDPWINGTYGANGNPCKVWILVVDKKSVEDYLATLPIPVITPSVNIFQASCKVV